MTKDVLPSCRYDFPDPQLGAPDGVDFVITGADLAPDTLLCAYARGFFPWFEEDGPIAWWSPDPRCVFIPEQFKPSKSLKRQAKKSSWQWSVNQAFEEVIYSCSLPRSYSEDTWIHNDMRQAYIELHKLGFAHSIEVWQDDNLVGGLYGLKIGQMYCGESMFHTQTNASKLAFWALMQHSMSTGVKLIDCQLVNDHLLSLGASIMSRREFLSQLPNLVTEKSADWLKDTNRSLDEVNKAYLKKEQPKSAPRYPICQLASSL